MMIGVSKWKYSQSAIDERNAACDFYGDPSDNCKNEAWFMRELSQQLQEKFDIERTLTFAFMDSYAQSGPNLIDEVQQSHWIEETNKLWSEATSRNETFDFKTIDDVLEENAMCKEENNRLNDIISEDIKQLKENVTSLDNKIIRNGEKITDNQSSMVLLTRDVEDLTEEVAGVEDDIVSVTQDVERNFHDINKVNEDVVSLNASNHQLETMIVANTELIATTKSSLTIITDNLSESLSIISTTLTESFLSLKSLVLSFHSSYISRWEEEVSMSIDLQRQKLKQTNEFGDQIAYETNQLESALTNYEDSTFKKQLLAFLQALNGVTSGISKMDPLIAENAINSATEVDGSIGDIFEGIVHVIRMFSILEDALNDISGGDIDDNIPDVNGNIAYYISTRWPHLFEDLDALRYSSHIFYDIW